MTPVITTENLEFSYGDTPVLRGIDLSVEAGEVVCLLGPQRRGQDDPRGEPAGLSDPDRRQGARARH